MPERHTSAIPALRPLLPSAERLLPYLRRIDLTRTYANWGPLETELAARLCERFRLPAGAVVTASSGTSALIGAVLATAGRANAARSLAIVPALTFVATALAVEQCGYQVQLADVHPETWGLEPEWLTERADLDRVGLVVVVAAFGRPVPQTPWQAFSERTGIPVVIDAAACFEAVSSTPDSLLGRLPVAISFHATKSFSTAEGGSVLCADPQLARRVCRALNFGFHDSRDTTVASTNGKMSEYHAAIGLAELDHWPEKQRAIARVVGAYRRVLAQAGLAERLITTPEVGSNYVLFQCTTRSEADRVQDWLSVHDVGYRLWYGSGVHGHAYFRGCAGDSGLTVTESLATRLLGLPMAPDLSTSEIETIASAVAGGVLTARDC